MLYDPKKKRMELRGQVVYANHIKRYRQLHDLTQRQFAKKIGISESTLYQIERRVLIPKLDVANQIASFFGIPVMEMFFDPANEPPLRFEPLKSVPNPPPSEVVP